MESLEPSDKPVPVGSIPSSKTATRTWILTGGMLGIVGVLAVVIFVRQPENEPSGYFEEGRCGCGHASFVRIEGDNYYTYSPGHDVPEHVAFSLRRDGDEWEVLSLGPPDGAWGGATQGQVVARLRFENGELYQSWSDTNWVRYPRVKNPLRVRLARLLTP